MLSSTDDPKVMIGPPDTLFCTGSILSLSYLSSLEGHLFRTMGTSRRPVARVDALKHYFVRHDNYCDIDFAFV